MVLERDPRKQKNRTMNENIASPAAGNGAAMRLKREPVPIMADGDVQSVLRNCGQ